MAELDTIVTDAAEASGNFNLILDEQGTSFDEDDFPVLQVYGRAAELQPYRAGYTFEQAPESVAVAVWALRHETTHAELKVIWKDLVKRCIDADSSIELTNYRQTDEGVGPHEIRDWSGTLERNSLLDISS